MILHLIGPGCRPAHAAEAADAIAAERGGRRAVPRPAVLDTPDEPMRRHRVIALGPEASASARLAGLAVDASLCPAGGPGTGGRIPLTARASLRRGLPAAALGGGKRPDAVVAWDAGGLAAATGCLPEIPRLLRLSDPPEPDTLGWLRARLASAGFDVAAASDALRDTLLAAGLPAGRVRVHAPELAAERLATAGSPPARDGASFAVAGGPGVEARDLVLAAALAQEAGGHRISLRLSPAADRLAEALDVADAAETSAGGGPRVVQDPAMETPWAALGGADTALLPVGGPAHAARWAALASRPRVFADDPARLGLAPAEASSDTDYVARHPLPRDLAAAMLAAIEASAAPTKRASEQEGQ